MKKIVFLLACFVILLSMLCCVSDPVTCSGIVTHKEYQEPAWGVGIGQNNRGTIGVVPMLKPEQYLVTVYVSDRDDVFSIEQVIYDDVIIGDTIECECLNNTFVCKFGEG